MLLTHSVDLYFSIVYIVLWLLVILSIPIIFSVCVGHDED